MVIAGDCGCLARFRYVNILPSFRYYLRIESLSFGRPWRRWPWPLPPPLGRPRPVSIAAFS